MRVVIATHSPEKSHALWRCLASSEDERAFSGFCCLQDILTKLSSFRKFRDVGSTQTPHDLSCRCTNGQTANEPRSRCNDHLMRNSCQPPLIGSNYQTMLPVSTTRWFQERARRLAEPEMVTRLYFLIRAHVCPCGDFPSESLWASARCGVTRNGGNRRILSPRPPSLLKGPRTCAANGGEGLGER